MSCKASIIALLHAVIKSTFSQAGLFADKFATCTSLEYLLIIMIVLHA